MNPNLFQGRPSNRRDLLGQVLTVREVEDYVDEGLRVYDVRCPFTISHTSHWCGFQGCPNG